MEVERGEERERIALAAIAFYGRAHEGLGENKVREVMYGQELSIGLEELGDEAFEGEEVDVWVGVKELEVDIDEALLASQVSVVGEHVGK